MILRAAHAGELDVLSALAMRSKAHWGYPLQWLEAWRDQLTVSPRDLSAFEVLVAAGDSVMGFAAVDVSTDPAILEHLWIDPDWMGRGVGRALFLKAAAIARERGAGALETDADPHALGFYERLGGTQVGQTPADVLGHSRRLPRVRFGLTDPVNL
jgi:GNAT superfamily N-acetyltransferase